MAGKATFATGFYLRDIYTDYDRPAPDSVGKVVLVDKTSISRMLDGFSLACIYQHY